MGSFRPCSSTSKHVCLSVMYRVPSNAIWISGVCVLWEQAYVCTNLHLNFSIRCSVALRFGNIACSSVLTSLAAAAGFALSGSSVGLPLSIPSEESILDHQFERDFEKSAIGAVLMLVAILDTYSFASRAASAARAAASFRIRWATSSTCLNVSSSAFSSSFSLGDSDAGTSPCSAALVSSTGWLGDASAAGALSAFKDTSSNASTRPSLSVIVSTGSSGLSQDSAAGTSGSAITASDWGASSPSSAASSSASSPSSSWD
mmetsp:Transcript_30631/g.57694  ORF Transcript_30631/g.57694 Transcript_30631/m.57694 type:complete len:260 (-) Transcript_30631:216-995(-)